MGRTRLSAARQWRPKYCAAVHKGHTSRRTRYHHHQLSSIIDARIAVAVDVAEPCFLLLLLTATATATLAWACLWAVSVSVSVLVFAIHSSRTVAVTVVVVVVALVVNALFSQCVHKKFKIQLENTHVAKC